MFSRAVRKGHGTPTPERDGPSRRSFLRRAGLAGALTAAAVGGADLMGLSSAGAATTSGKRPGTNRPGACECIITYTYSPYQCNGGKACPSGQCCYHATGCGSNTYACFTNPGGCANFTECVR